MRKTVIQLRTNLVHPMPPLSMMPICNTVSFQASCEYHSARLLVPKSLQPKTMNSIELALQGLVRQEEEVK